jgi:ribonuclease HII
VDAGARLGRNKPIMAGRIASSHQSGNLFELDGPLWREGFERIAGIDEAGRGPLAGPVVAAAVIFEPRVRLRGLDDSKRLTADERADLFDRIFERAVAVGVGFASAEEIDDINILQATHLAAKRALEGLAVQPDCLVTDYLKLKTPLKIIAESKGDQRSHAVAAASVVAKVTRDRLMERLSQEYPGYGLESHKGYPTRSHYDAIAELGASTIHRRSFAGVDFFGGDARPSMTLARLRREIAEAREAALRDRLGGELAGLLASAKGFLPEIELRELAQLAASLAKKEA